MGEGDLEKAKADTTPKTGDKVELNNSGNSTEVSTPVKKTDKEESKQQEVKPKQKEEKPKQKEEKPKQKEVKPKQKRRSVSRGRSASMSRKRRSVSISN